VEALLDWMVMPPCTLIAGITRTVAVQSVMAQALGPGVPLNANQALSGPGTQPTPVGVDTNVLQEAIVFEGGETVREALRMVCAYQTPSGVIPSWAFFTVDFWYGLRFWMAQADVPTRVPEDYAPLTMLSTPAGPNPAALDHETDSGEVVRQLYVKGVNAAASGFFSDGSGLPGPTAFLNDASILTGAARDAAAQAYFFDKGQSVRGSYRKETFLDTGTVAAHVQAQSRTVVTDAQVGLSAADYPIGSITKRYFGAGLETWTVTYGGLPASLPNAIRRLTRAVRS
jgi:hypothetical protein